MLELGTEIFIFHWIFQPIYGVWNARIWWFLRHSGPEHQTAEISLSSQIVTGNSERQKPTSFSSELHGGTADDPNTTDIDRTNLTRMIRGMTKACG